MKIFVRLYFGIVLILVAVMLVSSLILVRTSLKRSIDNAVENGKERHEMVQSLLKSNIIIVTRDKLADKVYICQAAQRTRINEGMELTVLIDDVVAFGDPDFKLDIKVNEDDGKFMKLVEHLKLEYLDVNQNMMEASDKETFKKKTNDLANIKIIY